jgi:1-acyl-sn-glycerol-3-phosphate acyltransferase
VTADLAFYRFVRGLIAVLARVLFRVRVEGASNIPARGAFVLAPVHRSNLDFALVALVTKRRMRYMGKDSIWKYDLPGRLITALGAFPVKRGTADREALRRCIEIVEGGDPLVLFPEGTRQSGPLVQPLFEGAAYVASRAGIPVIPVGIGGSEAAMPKGAKMIRPTRVTLVVGEAIDPPAPAENGRVPRSAVAALTERLQGEIQELFDRAQARS